MPWIMAGLAVNLGPMLGDTRTNVALVEQAVAAIEQSGGTAATATQIRQTLKGA